MDIKFIFGFIPVPVFFVDSLGEWQAGRSYGAWIKIKKTSKDDKPLLEHELIHSRLFYAVAFLVLILMAVLNSPVEVVPLAFIVEPLLYRYVQYYRYFAEVLAYKKQASLTDDPFRAKQLYAKRIREHYGLDKKITKDVIEDLM